MGSHDSLSGLKVLENMGMDVEGLGEQPASNPLLPDKKGVSLAGGSGWSAREFSFHHDHYWKLKNSEHIHHISKPFLNP